MSHIAVIKPDHLGDLVLSAPAIRAIARRFGAVTLFVSSTAMSLAQFLFPHLKLCVIDFPHLARCAVPALDTIGLAAELDGFQLVLWLRDDPWIRGFADTLRVAQDFAGGSHLVHESALQKRMLLRHVGSYSRSALFSEQPIQWPSSLRSVGLCISAGFPANRWPNVYWLELAVRLHRDGIALTLIGGPAERIELMLLSSLLGAHKIRHTTVAGGIDFAGFLTAIDDLDLVIATDSGTGHICSLAKPVLSIFGASPWRRFAPFGHENMVITRDLSCSPCIQFSLDHVNGCLTRHCLIGVAASDVMTVLNAPGDAAAARDITVVRGTSHRFEQ